MAIPELGARISQSGLAWCHSTYVHVTTFPILCYLWKDTWAHRWGQHIHHSIGTPLPFRPGYASPRVKAAQEAQQSCATFTEAVSVDPEDATPLGWWTCSYRRETIETSDSYCSSRCFRPLPDTGLLALSCLGPVFNRLSCSVHQSSSLFPRSTSFPRALSQEVPDGCLWFLQTLLQKTGWGCDNPELSKHRAGSICSDSVETLGWGPSHPCCSGVLSRLDEMYFKKWVVHAVSQAAFLPELLIWSDQATRSEAWLTSNYILHCSPGTLAHACLALQASMQLLHVHTSVKGKWCPGRIHTRTVLCSSWKRRVA